MRLFIAVLATLGLSTAACGKKADPPKPEPTKATEPTKAPEPTKATEPVAEADVAAPVEEVAAVAEEATVAAAPETEVAPPADRAAAAVKSLDDYAQGNYEASFANLADTVEWTEVGSPMVTAPVVGKAAVIELHKKQNTGFTEMKFKASRIIEMGEYLAVEAVWAAKNSGAMADGTAATNKDLSVAGVYLMHFGADGKVDKVWNIFDTAQFVGQLGLVPGLGNAAAFPETTEVVKGDPNQAYLDAYKANTEKLNATTAEEVFNAFGTDDVTTVDSMTGTATSGKAENIAAFKKLAEGWGDIATKVEMSWSAGDWVVAVQTMTATYKGGIANVEAKDQKITTTQIAVARFESGKLKWYKSYNDNLGILGQLGVQIGGAAKPPEAGALEKTGVDSCDKFITLYAQCVDGMPEAARGPAKDALVQMTKAWKDALTQGGDAAKTGLEAGCKQAFESNKASLGAACPGVKWE